MKGFDILDNVTKMHIVHKTVPRIRPFPLNEELLKPIIKIATINIDIVFSYIIIPNCFSSII